MTIEIHDILVVEEEIIIIEKQIGKKENELITVKRSHLDEEYRRVENELKVLEDRRAELVRNLGGMYDEIYFEQEYFLDLAAEEEGKREEAAREAQEALLSAELEDEEEERHLIMLGGGFIDD